MKNQLLEVCDLKVWFPVKKGVFARTVGHVKAVDGVSFSIRRGETLGIVGESGSGKSTIARAVTGLVRPTAGTFRLAGKAAMVFQDPLGSMNPRMTIRAILQEASHSEDAVRLLERVGLDGSALDKYPHEFSGGQRQRICIARAVATHPDLLICDEAVSALDLSVRSHVLELLKRLRDELELSMMFITHDLGVVQHVADEILVMSRGKAEEKGPCGQVLKAPQSEYTRYLMRSVPKIGKPLT